jgi:CheY-like chemotaxis protein
LDLTMPGMTGFEAIAQLKEEPLTAKIPVVIVTSQMLSVAQRDELMRNAIAIVGKDALDHTDMPELLRRAVNHTAVPSTKAAGPE